jgi:hypothetical protein
VVAALHCAMPADWAYHLRLVGGPLTLRTFNMLILCARTSTGPPIHWIGSLIGSAIIGIANYAIYMATIDYMICAYGPYSASATGGNGWARDFLAGVLTLPATPFFSNIGGEKHLAIASTILFCISLLLVVSVYVIYWKGPVLRKRSPFAQQLKGALEDGGGRRASTIRGPGSRVNSVAGQGSGPVSRRASATRGASTAGADGQRPRRMQRGSSAGLY